MKERYNIIAAVRSDEDFKRALETGVDIIFDLKPDLITLKAKTDAAHSANKKLFIHIDLATGIGKDKSGLQYAKNCGCDGIISTRVNIIKMAREIGMFTVQRFFIVDSHFMDTTVEALKSSKPDMIELMPGIAQKAIKSLKAILTVPIIAGGLIDCEEEVENAIAAGASAVSTGKAELWG